MPRTELAHYTNQQAEEHLRDALQLVETVGPPEDLRAITFTKAVEMLSAKNIIAQPVAPILGGFGEAPQ
jgi:hypothetical protein